MMEPTWESPWVRPETDVRRGVRMTARHRFALTIILACMKLAMLVESAHGGQQLSDSDSSTRRLRRHVRITQLRPIRAKGRADAGYPVLQTTANVTRVAANLSGLLNPVGWFFR